MYQISDKQIDFILEDLSAQGLEMVSLQQDLLDHICCIIETKLEENGDFEHFYRQTITTFYKDHLWEIEEETIRLQTFKNYYIMKKIMIYSGAITTALLTFGLIFKFMHWPGASALILLGILTASLVFLPLVFTLRIREKQATKDKVTLLIGSICCILITLHVLFKVMHWPFANLMGVTGMFILIAIYLPVFFFGGVRNPETKVNTIVTSVLIIIGCALVLTVLRSPMGTRIQNIRNTANYMRSEKLLALQLNKNQALAIDTSVQQKQLDLLANQIFENCEKIKADIIESETGSTKIAEDFEKKEQWISDDSVKDLFNNQVQSFERLTGLAKTVEEYNTFNNTLSQNNTEVLPYTKASIMELKEERSLSVLNSIVNLQLFLLQLNEHKLAVK